METDSNIAIYELSYHVPVSLTEKEQEAILDRVRSALSKNGGVFLAEGSLEETDLAYPMAKNGENFSKSMFGWMKFEIDPVHIASLKDDTLAQEKSIIRAVVIRTVREDTRASAQARVPQSAGLVQEVETKGVLERKTVVEDSTEDISEEAISKSIDDIIK